jgi:hypothetical protein
MAPVASCTGVATGTPCALAEGVVGTCGDGTCGGPVIYTAQRGAPTPAPGPFPKCANVTCGVCLTCDRAGECVRAPDETVCPMYGGGAGVCAAGVCVTNLNDGRAASPGQLCDICPSCQRCADGKCVADVNQNRSSCQLPAAGRRSLRRLFSTPVPVSGTCRSGSCTSTIT